MESKLYFNSITSCLWPFFSWIIFYWFRWESPRRRLWHTNLSAGVHRGGGPGSPGRERNSASGTGGRHGGCLEERLPLCGHRTDWEKVLQRGPTRGKRRARYLSMSPNRKCWMVVIEPLRSQSFLPASSASCWAPVAEEGPQAKS